MHGLRAREVRAHLPLRQLDLCSRQSPPRAPSRRASTTCSYGYHLCNLRDLYSGGYHVARSMGWATSNSHIWTSEEFNAGGGANTSWAGGAPGATKAGLGLCCADNE